MYKLILALGLGSTGVFAATLALDASAIRPGPVTVNATSTELEVHWKDDRSRAWTAAFSLTAAMPTKASVSVEGKRVIERGQAFYRAETGKRRGGFDAFFDFPPSHPDGTRAFLAEFHPTTIKGKSIGERVEVSFDGMRLGIFHGSLRYIFYPGSRLIEQQAALTTDEPDTAYFYDAGLRIGAD